jgi:hypothetical protein
MMQTKSPDIRAGHVFTLEQRHQQGSSVLSRFECSCGERGDWHSANVAGRCASQYEGHIQDLLRLKPAKPAPVPRVLAPCGTDTAFRRHKKHGEEPCEACIPAHESRWALKLIAQGMPADTVIARAGLLRKRWVELHGAAAQ